jgi:hypothetical protein
VEEIIDAIADVTEEIEIAIVTVDIVKNAK